MDAEQKLEGFSRLSLEDKFVILMSNFNAQKRKSHLIQIVSV